MKIAIIAHQKFPLKEPYAGGLEMITHLLVKELENREHQVSVYAPSGSQVSKLISLDEPFKEDDVNKHELIDQVGPDIRENLIFSQIFQNIDKKDYDIIHNHSHHYLPIILGNRLRTPFITSFHTPVFPELSFGLKYIEKEFDQYFTTVSKSLGETYSPFLPGSSTVYNGIEVHKWMYSLAQPEDYCIWYGRLCKEKAPHLAIQAALKARTRILLAGPGEETLYFREYVAPLIAKFPDMVEYLGHLEQVSLNELLKNARAFLFTSTWDEPYGLAIAESLSSGTPVISWNKGAAPEIISKECGALVTPYNVEEMAEYLKNYDRYSREACRKRAENFCDGKTMVNAYLHLYEKCINKKNSLC